MLIKISPFYQFTLDCSIDPLGQPTVMVGNIVSAHVVCPSVSTFQNIAKQNKAETMFATG